MTVAKKTGLIIPTAGDMAKPKAEALALLLDPWIRMPDSGEAVRLVDVVGINGWENALAYYPDIRAFIERLKHEGVAE